MGGEVIRAFVGEAAAVKTGEYLCYILDFPKGTASEDRHGGAAERSGNICSCVHVCWCLLFFKSSGDIAARVSSQTHISETDRDHVRPSVNECRTSLAPPAEPPQRKGLWLCVCAREQAHDRGERGSRGCGRWDGRSSGLAGGCVSEEGRMGSCWDRGSGSDGL